MRKKAFAMLLLLLGICCGTATAQSSDQKAEVIPVLFPNSSAFTALSDNGLWAVSCGPGEDQSSMFYPYLINTTTGEYTPLWTAEDEANLVSISVNDVTNDGNIIVGNHGGAAYYNVAEGQWHQLPGQGGEVTVVTPDGKYIGGWTGSGNAGAGTYTETPLLWERQDDGSYVQLDVLDFPNFPVVTGNGYVAKEIRITEISADGNLIAGGMNFTGAGSFYIYNRTTHETVYPGPDMHDSSVNEQLRVQVGAESFFSNNGKYLTGMYGGTESASDAASSFLYDIENDVFTGYNTQASETDRFGTTVSNSGVVFACSPAVNPLRSTYIRYKNLWIGLDELLQSRYGINFYDVTGYDYTGLVLGISDDEKTIIGQSLTQSSGYIIRLPESISEAASHVNPLDAYTVFPAEGSQFSAFSSAQITFNTEATLSPSASVQLLDASGSVVRSYRLSAQANGRTFVAGGITSTLTPGQEYTLRYPAGTFLLASDETYKSPQIDVKYVGCEPVPANASAITPANSAAVSEISAESPIQMKFNMSVAVSDDAHAYLYEEGNDNPVVELTFAQSDLTTVFLYPALRRYLSKDKNYSVVVEAGSITDIMGFNPNTEFSVNYVGAYVPEVPVDGSLFSDDFNDPSRSMTLYLLNEGDHNAPSSIVTPWGFDKDNSPWIFVVRESESSSDYCAASHSMYNPSGKSNDWMALPQLQIENEFYRIEFDAQSYKLGRNDHLKVYVVEDDNVYSAPNMPNELRDKFLSEGDLIFDQQVTPGEDQDEEGLANGWQHFDLSLADYAGKNIYIAFVNDNEDQSAVFLDNVRVYYQGDFYITPDVEQNVVAAESVPVAMLVRITGDDTYNNLNATLTSGDFTSTYTASDLNLTKDSEVYSFTFPEELPLTIGESNPYSINVTIDGTTVTASGTINDLAFETTKRVVVEESTGQQCSNCPQGILALEHLNEVYGEQVIPIAIHSSIVGTDLFSYEAYNSYFGITAQPNGVINRVDTLYAPMYRAAGENDQVTYSFTSPTGNKTFMDIVQRELLSPAVAEIGINSAVYDSSNGLMQVSGDVNYALNLSALNHNIAFVVLEDGLRGVQLNNLYSSSNPIFGDFGQNGLYGTGTPIITFDHVARKVADERFGGISGLVPVEVTANQPVAYSHKFSGPTNVSNWANTHLVAILLDATTGDVVNAAVVPVSQGTVGIKGVVSEGEGGAVIGYADGAITVSGADGADVAVYDINGTLVSKAKVNGTASINTNGLHGIFIVKVSGENVEAVKKIIVR